MPELIETLSKHNMKVSITRFCVYLYIHIVGKGGHTHPPPLFSRSTPFLEIQDVPAFYLPIKKT